MSTAVSTQTAALTPDQFRNALPDKMKKSVNQELIDNVNKALSDPDFYEQYRENLLSYAGVMQEGKFQIPQYIAAVKYVSYKLMGKTNIDAYSLTFPDKIQRFTQQGVAGKDIASYVTAYNKSKLVSLLMEQTMVPTWVLNQDLYQKALNVQAELMITARSEKVRSDAAKAVMDNLKPPDMQKVELNLGKEEHSSIDELRKATQDLVAQQREAIAAGASSAAQIAKTPITVEGERLDDK